MTCPGTESGELLDGHIVALSRGSQLRVRLEDGREIRAIPVAGSVGSGGVSWSAHLQSPCPGAHVQASEAAPYRVDRAS